MFLNYNVTVVFDHVPIEKNSFIFFFVLLFSKEAVPSFVFTKITFFVPRSVLPRICNRYHVYVYTYHYTRATSVGSK